MKPFVPWLIAAPLLCACDSKPEPSGNPPPAVTTKATATATGRTPAAEAPLPKEAVALALKTLDAWVATQNAGKLDDYLALYDANRFRGVTRTASGGEQKFSFAQWKEQRSRMFGTKVTVAADSPEAVSWAEKPGLGSGMVEVHFTQRWKNPTYADHGPKVIHVRVDKGVAKIVHEELISSTAGWTDASQCTDRPDSETPCELADGRWGWCKGGVCKNVCPAKHSYSPDDAQCHQLRDCKSDQTHDDWETPRKTAQCNHCIGQHCMDPGATRNLVNQD